MMEAVLEGMSEYYSQNLAREVMKGLRETALQCKHTGGKPPLGYDVDPLTKRLVINPEEAETVKLIFSMYSRGSGYSPILDKLHALGRKTKSWTFSYAVHAAVSWSGRPIIVPVNATTTARSTSVRNALWLT